MHHLTWTGYATFLLLALVVCIAPGPDFAVVVKSALAGGRLSGMLTAVGVGVGSAVQGTVAAFGLGAVIVASRPLFEAIKWAGVAYLCYLAVQALRSACRPRTDGAGTDGSGPAPRRRPSVRLLQGLLTNLTNPKILVFYLSVLPQFLPPDASVIDALTLANTLPVVGTVWLVVTVSGLHLMRRWMVRQRVRRALDAVTGLAMLGLAGKVAADSG